MRYVLSRLPSAADIVEGRAEVSPALSEEMAKVRRDESDRVMPLMQHDWWSTNGNRTTAKAALREAARSTSSRG
ncbi:hypothetical protein [Fodinicola feengrottensis]|uniref:hypothetical protein n=1 Tax=Fodinicola feengrottensis TaxID=435914 RepID=UPI0013D70403|nr:hypothetical protein [Fodinicola feengrottensis]